jgi:hypothetical protein
VELETASSTIETEPTYPKPCDCPSQRRTTTPMAGHYGATRTLDLVTRDHYWPPCANSSRTTSADAKNVTRTKPPLMPLMAFRTSAGTGKPWSRIESTSSPTSQSPTYPFRLHTGSHRRLHQDGSLRTYSHGCQGPRHSQSTEDMWSSTTEYPRS